MKEKNLSKLIMVVWTILVILEIYKQFVFSYDIQDGMVTWRYQWYIFPYQFCATPLTFLPFIALNKGSNKFSRFIKEGCIMFCSTFNFFAGLSVLIFPEGVFVSNLGIDIQTMVHHGLQVVLGIYIYVYYHKKLKYISFFKALPIFAFFLTNAMLLNVTVVHFTDATFNMFFISPYFPCTLLILSEVYAAAPYPVFLFVYIVGFTLCAFMIYNIFYWITFYIDKKHSTSIKKLCRVA